MNDLIIQNIQELILPKSTDKPLKGGELDELEVVENGTVVIKDGKVGYSGPVSYTHLTLPTTPYV